MPLDPRRLELLTRRWRDTRADLAALEAGELWHPMSQADWRRHLIGSINDIEEEMDAAEFEE